MTRDGPETMPDPEPSPSAAEPGLERRPVTTLKGVGPRLAGTLRRLGIETVQDLLFHLPHRYEDRTRISPLGGLQPGTAVVVEGGKGEEATRALHTAFFGDKT
jgi:RecG-like helicase